MKALLTAIKSALQSEISYIRDRDIYITPDVNIIAEDVMMPCIGIKDGAIQRIELAGSMLEIIMDVTIAIHVGLQKKEASIMGSGSKKGVLEIAADIHNALDENLLDITGMQAAFSSSESDSLLFGRNAKYIQQKKITYRYTKEIAR